MIRAKLDVLPRQLLVAGMLALHGPAHAAGLPVGVSLSFLARQDVGRLDSHRGNFATAVPAWRAWFDALAHE